MPRYFFHSRDDAGFVRDREGVNVAGLDEARRIAIRMARANVIGDVRLGLLSLRGAIEVQDEAGRTVIVVRYSDAVNMQGLGYFGCPGEEGPEPGLRNNPDRRVA